MNSSELRKKYLKFFEEKGHKVIPSSSLIPEGDSTTLFTGSGMQPMVPYLLGQKHPLGTRIADSQKSFRAEDIEEVGDNRHTTFFEMLGNWSFGDYWKQEQLSWIFQFLTEEAGIDPKKLYVTVFIGDSKNNIPRDDESADIWRGLFKQKGIDAKVVPIGPEANGYQTGMDEGRIFYYDAKKNWWSRSGTPEHMPAGEPGGPDSEMFYEFTDVEHNTKFGKYCHPNCDCGRFLEIGNNVFMEYKKNEDGTFSKLPQRNVDFGGGLERITTAANSTSDVFQIDSLKAIVDKIQSQSKVRDTYAERVIADHIRAAVFLISDGVIPSNKDRGYILRKILRRAIRYGYSLTTHDYWQVAESVVVQYQDSYPELLKNKELIILEFIKEFKKFISTLENGLKVIKDLFKKEDNIDTFALNNTILFDLYQSYGFPVELSLEEINRERNSRGLKSMDQVLMNNYLKMFHSSLKKHQDLSRTASAGQFKGGLASNSDKVVRLHTATHLMNAALRKVLGDNVWQKGSNITEERTRFDFTHDKKMTDEEKDEVERLVNEWIQRDLDVNSGVMPVKAALEDGVIGVFGEKYGDIANVYTISDLKTGDIISREFCGGPHVQHTGAIGKFKIQKEEAVSAGVRRIKAIIE